MIATYCKAKSINLTNIYSAEVPGDRAEKIWIQRLGICAGGNRSRRIKRRTGSKPACRRVWKDHRQAITDEVVLERVAEAAKIRCILPSPRAVL